MISGDSDTFGGRANEKPTSPALTPRIPDHQLIRVIGSGAYGDVWLARTLLGHYRAVKIIHASRFPDPTPLHREFEGLRRYEPISRSHPGLVAVFQVGRNDAEGFFYYVMEAADDLDPSGGPDSDQYHPRTLQSDLDHDHQPMALDRCLQLGERIADAVGLLHTHSLIHRDLKPDNIIFVGGEPKLADIGLVTLVGEKVSMIGAPAYICPLAHGTPRGDIFAVGKILYELVTGKPAIDFPELPDEMVHWSDAAARTRLNPVWTRACSGRLDERYASTAELQEDLRRLRTGKRVRRPVRLWLRSHKAALVSAFLAGTLSWAAIKLHGRVTRGVAARSNAARVVLEDDFDRPALDESRWSANWTDEYAYPGFGSQTGGVAIVDGAMTLTSGATHANGFTSAAYTWVDAQPGLSARGDLRITATISGESRNGSMFLMLCDGRKPRPEGNPSSHTLFEATGPSNEGLVTDPRTVRIEISESSQLAMVDILGDDEGVRAFDLSGHDQWRLRFQTRALSSDGFLPGRVRMAVGQVQIVSIPPRTGLTGRVLDAASHRGVAGAVIKDATGRQIARSHRDGSFRALVPAGTHQLQVEHADYTSNHSASVQVAEGHRALVSIQLTRETFVRGDVVNAIDCRHINAHAIAASPEGLYVAASADSGSEIIRLSFDGQQRDYVASATSVAGLAIVGGTLYATDCYPGELWRLSENSGQELVTEFNTVDWPVDLAFDGTTLWMVERFTAGPHFALYTIDLNTNRLSDPILSSDSMIQGVAWDGHLLWVSSLSGVVVGVDPAAAVSGGTLRAGEVARFEGYYFRLAFANGFLWGLDRETERICKIKL